MSEVGYTFLTFRCTEGEYARLRENASMAGLRVAAYVEHVASDMRWPEPCVDWDVMEDACAEFCEGGLVLNEIAHSLNSIAMSCESGVFGQGVRNAIGELPTLTFELQRHNATLRDSLSAYKRTYESLRREVVSNTPHHLSLSRHVSLRVRDVTKTRVLDACALTGHSITNVILAQCVYRDSIPLVVPPGIVHDVSVEYARQANNFRQVSEAVGHIVDTREEKNLERSLPDAIVSMISSSVDEARSIANAIHDGMEVVARASSLTRDL